MQSVTAAAATQQQQQQQHCSSVILSAAAVSAARRITVAAPIRRRLCQQPPDCSQPAVVKTTTTLVAMTTQVSTSVRSFVCDVRVTKMTRDVTRCSRMAASDQSFNVSEEFHLWQSRSVWVAWITSIKNNLLILVFCAGFVSPQFFLRENTSFAF